MNSMPAVGIEGDWSSANPRFSQLTIGAPVYAGSNGVTVGRFAWLNGNIYSQPFGGGRIAFIHRDQPSLIVPTSYANWLPQSSMIVPPGLEVVGYDSADVWCKFAGGATPGYNVYANYADGTAVSINGLSSPTTVTASSSAIAAAASQMSMTGSISGTMLTITAATTGLVYNGTILAGAGGSNGVAVITGTQVLAQVTPLLTGETAGGVGRYLLNYDYGVSTVQSSTITGTIGILTVTTTAASTINIGDTISQTGVTAGTYITANAAIGGNGVLTGAGGAGTYAVSPSQTGGTGTATFSTNVLTNWFVDTYAGTNELAKISRHG